jgi:putative SOS response-associated peptidase YedK
MATGLRKFQQARKVRSRSDPDKAPQGDSMAAAFDTPRISQGLQSMCANYTPTRQVAWESAFRATFPAATLKTESFPGYDAPIITNEDRDDGVVATFGLLPSWAKPDLVRSTYNARSETAALKPSFRNAWKRAQFCIIPAEVLYEPCYESGKPERWAIREADHRPMGIAGLWEARKEGGLLRYSFAMLTINADAHPLMKHMHKPTDEKRMVVILDRDHYEDWLQTTADNALAWMAPYPAKHLVAEPAPKASTEKNLTLF